jgi:hypothetical protein
MAGQLRFSLEGEYLRMRSGGLAERETLTQATLRPVAVYSPIDQLNLVFQIPLVGKSWKATGEEPLVASERLGLGDVDLGLRWFLFKDVDMARLSRQGFAASLGTSFPTGSSNATENGIRVEEHAQLGTGAFGPYVGMLYAYHRDPWNAFASATAKFRTENSHGYRYGNALLWSLTSEFQVSKRVSLGLGLDGRFAGRDSQVGGHSHGGEVEEHSHSSPDLVGDTGGLVLAAAPGVRVNLFGGLWLQLKAQLPVFTHLYGEQWVGPTFFSSLNLVPE